METKAALKALAALAQDSRLAIFRYLVERGPKGAHPGTISEALDLVGSSLSFHLKELTHAELVIATQEGRYIRYAASLDAVQALVGYLTENCCGGDPSKCMPVAAPAAKRQRPAVEAARPRRRVAAR